ncbi:MAG: hypothetical protein H7Y60_10020 [Rhodospirillaceae bacterium]|nr:hypothetical protein [Rhodospirillales bacterium]
MNAPFFALYGKAFVLGRISTDIVEGGPRFANVFPECLKTARNSREVGAPMMDRWQV